MDERLIETGRGSDEGAPTTPEGSAPLEHAESGDAGAASSLPAAGAGSESAAFDAGWTAAEHAGAAGQRAGPSERPVYLPASPPRIGSLLDLVM